MIETPTLLIATPSLPRPRLARSLVLLTVHDKTGSLGFVVNRESDVAMRQGLRELGVPLTPAESEERLLVGGPSRRETGWLLFDTREHDAPENSIALNEDVALTACPDAAQDIVDGGALCLAISGYVGWGPGELEQELGGGGWLTSAMHADVLFDTPSHERWAEALTHLGVPRGVLCDPDILSA